MSETVKLIIELPKDLFERIYQSLSVPDMQGADIVNAINVIKNGTPLDSNSEKAEVQAYFDGQAYGWEEGRKALLDDIKAEIKSMEYHMIDCDVLVDQEEVLDILDNIGKENNK